MRLLPQRSKGHDVVVWVLLFSFGCGDDGFAEGHNSSSMRCIGVLSRIMDQQRQTILSRKDRVWTLVGCDAVLWLSDAHKCRGTDGKFSVASEIVQKVAHRMFSRDFKILDCASSMMYRFRFWCLF